MQIFILDNMVIVNVLWTLIILKELVRWILRFATRLLAAQNRKKYTSSLWEYHHDLLYEICKHSKTNFKTLTLNEACGSRKPIHDFNWHKVKKAVWESSDADSGSCLELNWYHCSTLVCCWVIWSWMMCWVVETIQSDHFESADKHHHLSSRIKKYQLYFGHFHWAFEQSL